MIAIKSIKEAFSLFIKNKTLWGISFVLTIVSTLISRFSGNFVFFYFLQWDIYLPTFLNMAISEVILISAVGLFFQEEINLKNMQKVLQKYSLRVFVLSLLYFVFLLFISIPFLLLAIVVPELFNDFIDIQILIFVTISLYLLPYFFATRFVVLHRKKIWRSVYSAFKLFWKRFIDSIVFILFLYVTEAVLAGLATFFAFSIFSSFGSFELTPSIKFFSQMLSTPISTVISMILSAFIVLWTSSSITIYFKKLEELGEFSE